LYYCCLPFNFSVSWAPHCSLFLLSRSADPTSRPRRLPVLASSFQRTPAKPIPSSNPLFLSFAGCKNTTFSHNNNGLFQLFFIITHKTMIIKKKKFENTQFHDINIHLIYINWNFSNPQKGGFTIFSRII